MEKRHTAETGQQAEMGNRLAVILIFEDSKDVSLYLSMLLNTGYPFYAQNDKNVLDKDLDKFRDLIAGEAMMLQTDCMKMPGELQTGFSSSPVPLVLFTVSNNGSRLTGLEPGADPSLTLPLNAAEFQIRLTHLFELRKKLHACCSLLNHFTDPHDPVLMTEDPFILKVREILQKNLDNDAFNMNALTSELAVSRAWLYRKFKSICNMGVCEYLKLLRLQKARELLTTSDLNITQFAFAAGFKNLSYFSRAFTLRFGITPKKMQQTNRTAPLQNKP